MKSIQLRNLSNTHDIILIYRDHRHHSSAKEMFLQCFQHAMSKEGEGVAADFGLTAFTVQITGMLEWKPATFMHASQESIFFLLGVALSCASFYCEDSKSSCLSLSSNRFCPLSRRAFNFLCTCSLRGKEVFPCNSE